MSMMSSMYITLFDLLLLTTLIINNLDAQEVELRRKHVLPSKSSSMLHRQGNARSDAHFSNLSFMLSPAYDMTPVAKDEYNCKLELHDSSINKFRHITYFSEANFVYLKLAPDPGVSITGSKIVVGETIWVWTFYGKEGGLQFLKWPVDFGIWSMGLLTSYVITEPMEMQLRRTAGNCSNLEVGIKAVDKIISNALVNLTLEMMELDEKYAPSFFCYLTRKFIDPQFLYTLCKHIVCPIEALKYNCCAYFFNVTSLKREIGCLKHAFEYDPFNWILPTVGSVILFGFCPIFLLYISHLVSDEGKGHLKGLLNSVVQNREEGNAMHEILILLNGRHHVTLFKTVCLPIKVCCANMHSSASMSYQIILNKVGLFVIPCLSLSVIALQVFIDYHYLHTFVLESVHKGVPLGFRSMLAGYNESKCIFLPYLGGPYVSVGIYLFITCLLLSVPSSVSKLLLSGLQNNEADENNSPLMLRLRTIETFGSVCIRKRHGYYKLYSVFLAQFFMLLNTKFWKHVLSVQYERWKYISCSKCCIFLLPFYFGVCIIEIVLCLAFYGYPIISFGLLIIKSYSGRLCYEQTRRNFFVRLFFCLLTALLIASVAFFLFMFCTIFMDACLFVTRVVVFTFTGIVVYPKVSYGYLIFILTVLYYVWQSVQDFSLVYQRLLKDTIIACEKLKRTNDRERLVFRSAGYKAIKESLFEYVIENHNPRRKQVFLTVFKVGIVLTILGLCINILIATDGFRELHVLMHVGTALFVCALPQIVKSVCRQRGDKFKQKRLFKEIQNTVTCYLGYSDEMSTDSESE